MSRPIRNQRAPMQYRRFGRSDMDLSVITLGGMRFRGNGKPRDEVPDEMLEHAAANVERAFALGINHIETAHGYGRSEHCYGRVLNEHLRIPRQQYWLMTKGSPQTAADVRPLIEEQLRGLRTDHIDLYAWHGINTEQLRQQVCAPDGPVAELLKLKAEGLIGAIGFSTHGSMETICRSIETDLFDFVNLHWYYFFQRNRPAIELAERRDMGVFIISPNDKGGQLFAPSETLRELCAPLTPIQFNARFCLSTPAVHTLSFGLTEAEHYAEAAEIFPVSVPLSPDDLARKLTLDARLTVDPVSAYEGWEFVGDPSGINIPEILRMRRLWKCYDLQGFGRYRYNMFSGDGHWFPGHPADEARLAQVQAERAPAGIDIRALLREAHQCFYQPREVKRFTE